MDIILILFGYSILLIAIGQATRGSTNNFFGFRFAQTSTTFMHLALFTGMFATVLILLMCAFPQGYDDIFGNFKRWYIPLVWFFLSLVAVICEQSISIEFFKLFRNFYCIAAVLVTLGVVLPVIVQDYNPRKVNVEAESITELTAPANDSLSDQYSFLIEVGNGNWGVDFVNGQDILIRNQCGEIHKMHQGDYPPQFENCGDALRVQFKSISGLDMKVRVRQQPNRIPFRRWLAEIGKSF